MKKTKQRKKNTKKAIRKGTLEPLKMRDDAAGIDVGATELWVAVPPQRDADSVWRFGSFTCDLHALADRLERIGVKTVAMESTGVYWIPLFQVLESRGLEVCLVNAQHSKHVAARKSDVLDCQWLQPQHSLGLLKASFRPPQQVCAVRSLLRHRESLGQLACQQTLLMQKALDQMNLQLHHVISDITGLTGLAILDAILAGKRDAQELAALRHPRVKASAETIAKALQGDYREEHLLALSHSLQLYRSVQKLITECDQQLASQWDALATPRAPQQPLPEATKPMATRDGGKGAGETQRQRYYHLLGVDLTQIEGINIGTIETLLGEVGPSFSRFRSAAAMASWAGLCPNRQVSGGKVLNSKTRNNANRVAHAFRLAANSLWKSKSALGDGFRRWCAKLGKPAAITATAHRLLRIVFHLVTTRQHYDPATFEKHRRQQEEREKLRLAKKARQYGFMLVPIAATS